MGGKKTTSSNLDGCRRVFSWGEQAEGEGDVVSGKITMKGVGRAGCTEKKQKKVSNNWEEGEEVVRALLASPRWWFKRKEAVGLVFAVICVHRGKHRSKVHPLSSFLIPHLPLSVSDHHVV